MVLSVFVMLLYKLNVVVEVADNVLLVRLSKEAVALPAVALNSRIKTLSGVKIADAVAVTEISLVKNLVSVVDAKLDTAITLEISLSNETEDAAVAESTRIKTLRASKVVELAADAESVLYICLTKEVDEDATIESKCVIFLLITAKLLTPADSVLLVIFDKYDVVVLDTDNIFDINLLIVTEDPPLTERYFIILRVISTEFVESLLSNLFTCLIKTAIDELVTDKVLINTFKASKIAVPADDAVREWVMRLKIYEYARDATTKNLAICRCIAVDTGDDVLIV